MDSCKLANRGIFMGDIVIQEVNYKAMLTLFINLLFLVAGICVMSYGVYMHFIGYWLPGVLISVMLLIAFIGALIKALEIKKLLTITHDGIIDNSTIGGIGYISFDDIKEFSIITINNKDAIAVIPKDAHSFLQKFNPTKRRMMNRNLNQSLPPVTIFINKAKDMEPEDILSLLQKRLSDYSSLYE